MSILDNMEISQADVRQITDDGPDVMMCPVDKVPADYLMLDEPGRVTLLVGVYEPVPHRLLEDAARKVYDYVCSIPSFSDFSKGILIPTPASVTPSDSEYEQLLHSYPMRITDRNHQDHLLCVSFNINVRSCYSLLKLMKSLYSATWGKSGVFTIGYPVLRWISSPFTSTNRKLASIMSVTQHMMIDESFINTVGMGSGGNKLGSFHNLRETDFMDFLRSFLPAYETNTIMSVINSAISRYWSRERMKFG